MTRATSMPPAALLDYRAGAACAGPPSHRSAAFDTGRAGTPPSGETAHTEQLGGVLHSSTRVLLQAVHGGTVRGSRGGAAREEEVGLASAHGGLDGGGDVQGLPAGARRHVAEAHVEAVAVPGPQVVRRDFLKFATGLLGHVPAHLRQRKADLIQHGACIAASDASGEDLSFDKLPPQGVPG